MAHAPSVAQAAVLVPSATAATSEVLAGAPTVRGYAFEPAPAAVDYDALLRSLGTTGFQGTAFERAVRVVNDMLAWRLSSEPVPADEADEWRDPARRAATRCTVFLAYTSNLISSGVRDIIRFLVQHRFVHVLVSTAGGVEEDFIKCLAPTYVGDFELDGRTLRKQGLNRIGNLLVPNDNYCKFEDWVTPILDQLLKEQKEQGIVWTPSKIIHRLGKEINHPDSVYYWAYKNNIPVFCPALTDGSLGDMIYFHSYRNPGLVVDIAGDIRAINDIALHAKKTGMIILGGGVVKHHTANANLMRNGADFSVYINTAQEFDGSDSGARPDEAVSWGKIKMDSHPVKVYGDATVIFPLLVAQTFAKQATQSV